MSDVDVLVVGGGISGLSVATSLVHKGLSVELWESSQRAGGKIETHSDTDGYVTERAANLVANFRPEVNRFIEQSNLVAKKAIPAPVARRYLIKDDKLVAVPTKLAAMITSPIWSVRGKARLLAEPFVRKGGRDDETVSEFITRRLGLEVLQKAMDPYVSGVLASDPDRANARSVLPRMTALEQQYGSLTLGILAHKILRRRTSVPNESFSFEGGMSTLVQSLVNDPRIQFRPAHSAMELTRRRSHWRVTGSAAGKEISVRARQVVLSVPANIASQLLSPLDQDLAQFLRGIQYTPMAVVHTGFDRRAVGHPMDGTGFLIPRRPGVAATGCLWMSSLFQGCAPEGRILFTNYLGGARLPEAAEWDDARSIDEILKVITPLMNIDREPEMVRIFRHQQALPLYYGDYYARMSSVTDRLRRLPGLHLEANYRGGVSVRDRIVRAYFAAETIANELAQSGRPSRTQFPSITMDSPKKNWNR
jgi:protoporphyrinogen/coproporphyrinogen III oxidase